MSTDSHAEDLPLSGESAEQIVGGKRAKKQSLKTKKPVTYPVTYIDSPGLVGQGPPPVGPDDDCSPE
jgi:hypothetical protein